ncbi:MAG: hypothetical protein BPH43C_42 [Phage 5P_1]|nr:MAG: hypothetical protein BPH43C_42 [Phage 5P_1]
MVWVTSANISTARNFLAGGGNSSNAICMGGYDGTKKSLTEKFNGSAWSTTGNLNTARYALAGGGNTSDAICMGGSTTTYSAVTELWSEGTRYFSFVNTM